MPALAPELAPAPRVSVRQLPSVGAHPNQAPQPQPQLQPDAHAKPRVATEEPEEQTPKRRKRAELPVVDFEVDRRRRKSEVDEKAALELSREKSKTSHGHHANAMKRRRAVGRRIEAPGVVSTGQDPESMALPIDHFGVSLGRQLVSETKESDQSD